MRQIVAPNLKKHMMNVRNQTVEDVLQSDRVKQTGIFLVSSTTMLI